MSNTCSPLFLSLGKLFGLDNKSSDEQEKDIENIKKLVEENKEAIEKINNEGKDAPKDITVWYDGSKSITNKPDKAPDNLSIDTYSTYRPIYGSKESLDSKKPLLNSGINFFETYVANDFIKNAKPGYTGIRCIFHLNLGFKSVSGMLYGLDDGNGFWPAPATVLTTISNKSVYADPSINDDLLPYNYIRFKTYSDGSRSVHLSVNEIGADDPLPC
jgi:hypothetical protein